MREPPFTRRTRRSRPQTPSQLCALCALCALCGPSPPRNLALLVPSEAPPNDSRMAHAVHLGASAAIDAFGVVDALLGAVGVAAAGFGAGGIALGGVARAAARGGRDQRSDGRAAEGRGDDAQGGRARAPRGHAGHFGSGGVVTGGRFLRQSSNCGSRPDALGGSRGRPMTGAPSRDQSMPLSLTLNHTKRARPRMFSNGTPPPWPPNHMRESWLLLRLSPMTQTSPSLTKKGP